MNNRRTAMSVVGAGLLAGLIIPLHPLTTWQQRAHDDIKASAPVVSVITKAGSVQEDDPAWNCFTMGNKSCGTIKHVTQELGDVLAEGDDRTGYYNWESCVVDTISVMCPDGRVVPISKD